MTGLAIFHLVTGTALGALAVHTLLNHLTLPRLSRMPQPAKAPSISVLIPARNEAERIGASVCGWAGQDYPDYELIVYDDDSSDETAARAAAAGGPGVRVIRGGALPRGWRGKPWACHRLRQHAAGEVLVFADADVVPQAQALRQAAGALAALGADAVSAVPRHESADASVRALVALQNWAALVFVPSWLAVDRVPPWLAAMTGQFLAIRTSAYDASGGFSLARGSLAEDAALGRRLAAEGYRVRLLDGARVLTCRPYASLSAAWRAHTRNLRAVFFDSSALLLGALSALTMLTVGPLVVLALGAATGAGGWAWRGLPLGELTLSLAIRALSDRRAGYSWWLVALHPVAVLGLLAMGLDAVIRSRLGRAVAWRGRRYESNH